MKILLTNDDGITAVGIQTLAKRLCKNHEIYIIAPESQRSGASHSASYFSSSLMVKKYEYPNVKKAYSVSGTPADCVYVGMNFLLEEKIDLVISGINHGWNVSRDCFYSGTIGAAREALFLGIPAIAISLNSRKEDGFPLASKVVENLIPVYMNDSNKLNYIFNVNVPYVKEEDLKGIKVIGLEPDWKYINDCKKEVIDENNFKITVTGKKMHGNILIDEIVGDASACYNGYVSITPLSLNMYAGDYLEELQALMNTENKKFEEN